MLDVGERVLLIWATDYALRYRFAPLAELGSAPTRWLTEIVVPEGNEPPDPRAFTSARLQFHQRGDVALVLVPGYAHGACLLRFDGKGDVRIMSPPPP